MLLNCSFSVSLEKSTHNFNSIRLESTETPLPLHGVEMELNFKSCVELEVNLVELEVN